VALLHNWPVMVGVVTMVNGTQRIHLPIPCSYLAHPRSTRMRRYHTRWSSCLSLRAAQGFMSSVMSLMRLDLPVPNSSTISRRQGTLRGPLSLSSGRRPRPLSLMPPGFGSTEQGSGTSTSIEAVNDVAGHTASGSR